MTDFGFQARLKYTPELDPGFRPIVMDNREYQKAVGRSGNAAAVKIAVERSGGLVSTVETQVFRDGHRQDNILYVDRLVKTLLWVKGGWKVIYAGPEDIGGYLQRAYAPGGARAFDAGFMGKIYDQPFMVEVTSLDRVPETKDDPKPLGRNLDGCRIGFDAGGSDRKVSAVIDGEAVYSEEVVWHPKLQSDPAYHYQGIMESMKTAAAKMPRVDAIGVSAAGVYIDNEVKAASLFLKVQPDDFEKKVKNIFIDIARTFGVPIEVANDGDVSALAGAMSLETDCVLGIAMGTSEAAGYVDGQGNITGWLNELAFVPVDYNPNAMEDEWSGDIGCGVKYFSQDGVIKLAAQAGIPLDAELSPAEKLKAVQKLMEDDDARAAKIYDSIGCYLGYALGYYAAFYDISHVLLLGRVTSGMGGNLLIEKAKLVLREEFPELAVNVMMPDEKARRVGQSVAAASLPVIG